MKCRFNCLVALIALLMANSSLAAEIRGVVVSVAEKHATVTPDSGLVPALGDKVEIFFKMPGVDVDVSVANGHVQEIIGQNIVVEIDKASATVSKGQLARIKSTSPNRGPVATARPATTSPSAGAPPSHLPRPTVFLGVQMIFDPASTNGALVQGIVPESPAAAAGFQVDDLIIEIDGSPVKNAEQVTNAVASMPPGTKHAFLVTRAGVPKKLEATIARLPSDFATSAGPNPLLGDWSGPAPGDAKVSFSFKEDNTLLWVVEEPNSAISTTAKYRVDTTVTPHVVELFDFEEGEFKGHTLRGFLELQSDGRLKVDLSEKQERGFSDRETILLSRATTPIVRSTKPAPTPYQAPTPPPDEALVTEAIGRYDHGDDAGAMEALDKALALNPKNARAFFQRGLCFDRKKDLKAAIADYEKAMELDPSMELEDLIRKTKVVGDNALVTEATERYKHDDNAGAMEAIEKAIALNPKNAQAFFWRGYLFEKKGDLKSAIADYEKAMELDPSMKLEGVIKEAKAAGHLKKRKK